MSLSCGTRLSVIEGISLQAHTVLGEALILFEDPKKFRAGTSMSFGHGTLSDAVAPSAICSQN